MSGACPCGTGLPYDACCAAAHAGSPSPTAEALMRSRYSAFVRLDRDHLLRTWHSSTRPRRLELDPDVRWTGLVVLRTVRGGFLDADGEVEFRASYDGGVLSERSRFVREYGEWRYVEGWVDGSVASGHG